jgi:hypothetical protein
VVVPVTDWFAAVWLVTSQKNGVSALGLQQVLGMGSNRTAWTWMHKLRGAMVRPDRDRLDGVVEVDETSVGGRERGKGTAGRGTTHKAVVAIAVEVLEPKGFGRVRLVRLREVNSESLCVASSARSSRPGHGAHGWLERVRTAGRSATSRSRSPAPANRRMWPDPACTGSRRCSSAG